MEIITPSGIFKILQNASYGELLIAILLVIILVVFVMYFIWRVACREGWL
jgi:predicted permease